jgi:uncharacterized membrane protein
MYNDGVLSDILPVHVAAGTLALVFGYLALAAAKGGVVHRKSGMLFTFAMATMGATGAFVALMNTARDGVSVIAGALTVYLVATGVLTVRRAPVPTRWSIAMGIVAVSVGVGALGAGVQMTFLRRPEAYPSFMFGIVALLAARGDVRLLRAGGIQGPARLVRHVWRMCFAMWIAAASFFLGPAGRVPEAINNPALRTIAVLLPLAVMVVWVWRLRGRRASVRLPILQKA